MVVVSAVIPTRGRPELLRRAVRSALAQTLRAIEVVVVVDGEDRVTQQALEEWASEDARLRIVALAKASVGRMHAIAASMRQWVSGLRFLTTTMNGCRQTRSPDNSGGAINARVILGTCKMIARTPGRDYVWPRRLPAANEQIGEYVLARRSLTRGEGYIQTSTFFVRRSLMLTQPFKSGQVKHQDTEWVLRLGRLPGAEVVFADDVLAIHNIEEQRATVSNKSNWEYSLAWLRRDRHLFTPRALSGFALYQISAEASDQGAWRAFPQLLLEALLHGKSAPRDYAIFLAIWFLPRRRRRRLRDWMASMPALRSSVTPS